eukprot:scaffold3087_cov130-Alexandrium_tamarense.AAC.28
MLSCISVLISSRITLCSNRYLPPDSEFLMSYYDFPEVFLCLFQDCSSHSNDLEAPSSVPFVTFFSGHIATICIIANHLYVRKHTCLSVCLHTFNWLQVIRLLATRGHYSIDLIIGYVVAVFVSTPAERLGLYYSRGVPPSLPQNIVETFEILIGVRVKEVKVGVGGDRSRGVCKCEDGGTRVAMQPSLQLENRNRSIDELNVQSETSVRVALEIVSELAHKRMY